MTNTSPLETLAAFAIAFAAGVISTAALCTYIGRLRAASASKTPSESRI